MKERDLLACMASSIAGGLVRDGDVRIDCSDNASERRRDAVAGESVRLAVAILAKLDRRDPDPFSPPVATGLPGAGEPRP